MSTIKLAISCTTYNRPAPLLTQLKELSKQLQHNKIEASLIIVNDASLRNYKKVDELIKDYPYPVKYVRFNSNQGKHHHWRIVDYIFSWYKQQSFDYALYLQDDLILHRDFLQDVIRQFETIEHPNKVCLNYVVTEIRKGRRPWTPAPRRLTQYKKLQIYRVGWVDLTFFANKDFFDQLDYTIYPINPNRWQKNPLLSSGVGRQISKRLFRNNASMWQVKSSLVTHGTEPSKMNPEARKLNPKGLKSI